MNEFELIERLAQDAPRNASTRVGIGDDCAVLDLGVPGRLFLFKADAVVEGIHYERGARPEAVGRKALGRALSDIAAMAGTPSHALVTLALPKGFSPEYQERVYAGINELARLHEVAIVGGETTTNPERQLISIALLGWVDAGRCALRSGARTGDSLWVTGELGGSLASGHHLSFSPRLVEARWLASRCEVHAMIDLSDGLAGDLRHILTASGVGAILEGGAIPVGAGAFPGFDRATALQAALTDGEDYELLFAIPATDEKGLSESWENKFPATRLSRIGQVVEGQQVRWVGEGNGPEIAEHGYVHFE